MPLSFMLCTDNVMVSICQCLLQVLVSLCIVDKHVPCRWLYMHGCAVTLMYDRDRQQCIQASMHSL